MSFTRAQTTALVVLATAGKLGISTYRSDISTIRRSDALVNSGSADALVRRGLAEPVPDRSVWHVQLSDEGQAVVDADPTMSADVARLVERER